MPTKHLSPNAAFISTGLLWLFYLVATLIRAPQLFTAPRFWAEDGIIYFLQARVLAPWDALWATPLNYLSLPANLAGVIAAQLPLWHAPYAALAVAFAVQLLFCGVVITHYRPALSRYRCGVLLIIPIVVTQSYETWLNPINSQFWLTLTAALILCAPLQRQTGLRCLGQGSVLLLAGLSGAVAAFLAPLFIARALLEKKVLWALYALPVSLGGWIVVLNSTEQARSLSFPLDVIAVKSFLQLLINNACLYCGVAVSGHPLLSSPAFALLALLGLILVYGTLLILSNKTGRWMLVTSASLLLLSTAGALGKAQWLTEISINSARYFFVPAVLLIAAVLLIVHPKYQKAAKFILACCLLQGVLSIIFGLGVVGQYDGQVWRQSVLNYHQGRDPLVYFNKPYCGFVPNRSLTRSAQTHTAQDAARQHTSAMQPVISAQSSEHLLIRFPDLSDLTAANIYLLRPTDGELFEYFDHAWQEEKLYLVGTAQYGRCYGGATPQPISNVNVMRNHLLINAALYQQIKGQPVIVGAGRSFIEMLAQQRYLATTPQ